VGIATKVLVLESFCAYYSKVDKINARSSVLTKSTALSGICPSMNLFNRSAQLALKEPSR
jgi:hypothetical protein